MKKLSILALVALFVSVPAFAQWSRHAVATPNATFAPGTGGLAAGAGPTTTNNNDTCDIGVTPAATLLLPYFEVETAPPAGTRGTDTFFTIVNTSNLPQIAHITVWTDWSFPVLDFNIFLTGYDVQPLSMYDIIVNGMIAPGNATKNPAGGTGANNPTGASLTDPLGYSPRGTLSATTNPNLNPTALLTSGATATCINLPGKIPDAFIAAVKSALVSGTYAATGFSAVTCAGAVGSNGTTAGARATTSTAIGYVTIDVANNCSTSLTDQPTYFYNEILFDNVLTGDYEIINKAVGSNYAGGNPLVHIRAIPEGGPAIANGGAVGVTTFPYTFYSRYINGQTVTTGTTASFANGLNNLDRRQPLPAMWAARYIQGGSLNLATNYRIWREGRTTGATACGTTTANPNAMGNSALPIGEVVRFDEHENPSVYPGAPTGVPISPYNPGTTTLPTLPETSNPSTASSTFPPMPTASGDSGGWMYLNLNSGVAFNGNASANSVNTTLHPAWPTYTSGGVTYPNRPSQNWVVVSMSGGPTGSTSGQYAVDFDATWLANGCTPPQIPASTANSGTFVIGPYRGTNGFALVCPAGATCTGTTYTGTTVTP